MYRKKYIQRVPYYPKCSSRHSLGLLEHIPLWINGDYCNPFGWIFKGKEV